MEIMFMIFFMLKVRHCLIQRLASPLDTSHDICHETSLILYHQSLSHFTPRVLLLISELFWHTVRIGGWSARPSDQALLLYVKGWCD